MSMDSVMVVKSKMGGGLRIRSVVVGARAGVTGIWRREASKMSHSTWCELALLAA
jgi:hypothetical protein